jgi:hypothetical protein
MNYISNIHKNFSLYFDNPEILTNPEEYFGPNYKILLNFWIYWETLTPKQITEYRRQADTYVYSYRRNVLNAAEYVESKIKRPDLMYFSSFDLEIFAAHILIESSLPLTFLPLLESL